VRRSTSHAALWRELPRNGEAWLLVFGLVASAVALTAIGLLIAQRGLGRNYASYDLSAYVEAARRIRDGAALYPQLLESGYRLGEVNLYLYPPPVALLFTPALLVSLSVASTIWGIALTALALAVAASIAMAVRSTRRPLAFAMVVGAFPLQWELANGNLTLVTLALALLAWRSGTGWRAAAPLALAMGLKLLAVPASLTLAIAGRTRLLALTGALLAAVVLVTWPFLGGAWVDWARLTYELAAGPQTRSYNVVPELLRAGIGRALLVGATVVALIAIGVLVRRGRIGPRLGFSAALAAAPYVSAFVFYPYAVLVLPVLVWIGLGRVPLWSRLAALAAWVLIDIQALDPDTLLPSALVGTALAVAATIGTAARRAAASSARPTGSSR
jgi:alpha-1,2-mannosyltransferase